ncbi:MAG: type I glyceraldehyde-3-phosphate dehydrogenase [Patescibacteria group bacterium]
MKKVRVAINGFGRIGRAFFRLAQGHSGIEIVAINDLGDAENLAYLLARDTVYGKAAFAVSYKDDALVVDGVTIPVYAEKDPMQLPWKKLNVDVVVEATGAFASYEKAKVHLASGAKRVVVTAPVKDNPEDAGVSGATVLMGVNQERLQTCDISSNASCTTNAGNPLIAILDETVGIEKAVLSTVHGYTASQSLVDGPSKKEFRDGRAAAQNIIPSTTGAAIATTKALTQLKGKFDGVAIRVPVVVGSLVDITFIAKRATTVEEINSILEKAAKEKRWEGIFMATYEPLVSSDIVGDLHASIADLSFTKVVDGTLVKVFAWYDNEMGYTNTLLMHVLETGKYV